MGTQPFEVRVPDATLADLRERLARTRFPDEPDGAGWDYGTSVKDEILTNVTLYWVTQTIGSSMRYYHEAQHRREWPTDRLETPTGAAIFPKDVLPPPRAFGERHFAIRRWTEMPRGGHFAALEEPELLAGELREFFGSLS